MGPGGPAKVIDIQQCKYHLFLKAVDVVLVSAYSVLFKLFISLFCLNSCVPGVQQKRMGTRAERYRPNAAMLVSCLLTFFCYVNGNSAEISPIMEICRECLAGVLQFLFFMNYCDPTAKHYAVMYPLKLA